MKTILYLLTLLFFGSCAQSVSVYVSGPEQLEGAIVLVDGQPVGTMQRIQRTGGDGGNVSGTVAVVVVPLGKHELRLEKSGLLPIVRRRSYTSSGEDYVNIADDDLRSI
ncbi:MAG TPA: hypothetical protein VGF48_17215 [Thermoanaerobaculia bacterium]